MQINVIKQCKVCETKENVYFHYGVCTCRACGAFFRRYLANENKCKYTNCKCLPEQLSEGNIDERPKTNLAKCRKCRLEKCLSVGMKRLDVGYVRQDVCRKEMEKQWNEINLQNRQIVDISINDQNQIDLILPIIEAKKRIMHSFNDLDDIFLHGPILFEEIILSNFNIFRLVDHFSPNPCAISFDELKSWESSFKNEGMLNNRFYKFILVDRLLCFGIAKSMPVFEKLTLSDQIKHLRHISYLFTAFTSSYLAWELGSETWTRKDNVMPALGIAKNNAFLHDDKIIKWADYSFTKSVAHFKRATLANVEYALLVAIIFTNSHGTGLSPEGKELLINESIEYTKILLRYNQRRLGLTEGAQRLDECFRLINASIENEYILRQMLSDQIKCNSMGVTNNCSNFVKKFLEKID